MKHHHKEIDAVAFFATDPSSNETVKVAPKEYFNGKQVNIMAQTPDMILQFGHFLADELREPGHERPEVRAELEVSLNGREPGLLVDPTVDLSAQRRTLMPEEWVLPLTEPTPA